MVHGLFLTVGFILLIIGFGVLWKTREDESLKKGMLGFLFFSILSSIGFVSFIVGIVYAVVDILKYLKV